MTQPVSRPQVVLVTRGFVIDESTGKLLVIRRAADDTHNAGLWECPGGKLEQGEDLTHALENEAMQETGLLVHPVFNLSFFDSYVLAPPSKYSGLLYLVLFGITRKVGGALRLSHEHDDHAWVTYDEMLDYELTSEARKAAIVLEPHLRRAMPVQATVGTAA